MKTIHIIEGIMSLVGKVGKLASKITNTKERIKEQFKKREEAKASQAKANQAKANLAKAKEEKYIKQELLKQEQLEQVVRKEENVVVEQSRVEVGSRVARKVERPKVVRASRRIQEKLVTPLPLHRKDLHHGKVIDLHQRAPTMNRTKNISKKRRTGT